MGRTLKENGLSKLWRLAEDKGSRLIIALDPFQETGVGGDSASIVEKYVGLLDTLRSYVVGVKVGFPLLFSAGLDDIKRLAATFRRDYYMLADFKLGDIPEVVGEALRHLEGMGFDGATVHVFQGGLGRVTKNSIDLFGVLMMSHPESQLFQANFDNLLEEVERRQLEGVVIGATKGEYIRRARSRLAEKVIISPGVMTQGAEPGQALKCGGDFEIVGRALTLSKDPASTARKIVEVERHALKG